jgi:hypothetical protein
VPEAPRPLTRLHPMQLLAGHLAVTSVGVAGSILNDGTYNASLAGVNMHRAGTRGGSGGPLERHHPALAKVRQNFAELEKGQKTRDFAAKRDSSLYSLPVIPVSRIATLGVVSFNSAVHEQFVAKWLDCRPSNVVGPGQSDFRSS